MDRKNELVQHMLWLRQYGLNDSHSGNASFRDGDTVWITPSGCCADTLQASDLLACNIDGTIAAGASLDTALHLAVYQQNSEAQVVMHSHGPHSIAMTMNGESYHPLDFEGQYYFSEIPVLNIAYQDYLEESPQRIANALKDEKCAIVRGHGVYVQAQSINLAYKWTCSLESSARLEWLAAQAGTLSR